MYTKELSKTYDPTTVETKWYSYWIEKGFFASQPNKNKVPYTIVIPPPNVTGILHMGHMLNNTIQDVMVRRARMLGREACWVPGTDHASIATEAKVVAVSFAATANGRTRSIGFAAEGERSHLPHPTAWPTSVGSACERHAPPSRRSETGRGGLTPEHLDVAADAGGIGETAVAGEQIEPHQFGERDVGGVVDGEVVAQLPTALKKRPVRGAF